jgi:hypothetical protein
MRAFAWRSCRRSWVVEALDLDDQEERLAEFFAEAREELGV